MRGIQCAAAYRFNHDRLWNTGSSAFADDDGGVRSRGMTCPSFAFRPPSKRRGRREDRVRAAPAVSQAMCIKMCAYEHTGLAEASGLPCAMALRLIRDRPGDPAFCDTIALKAALAAFELDACIGASDPNDFTVRKNRARQSRPHVHRSLPLVCDDGLRPSGGTGWRESYF